MVINRWFSVNCYDINWLNVKISNNEVFLITKHWYRDLDYGIWPVYSIWYFYEYVGSYRLWLRTNKINYDLYRVKSKFQDNFSFILNNGYHHNNINLTCCFSVFKDKSEFNHFSLVCSAYWFIKKNPTIYQWHTV